MKKGRGGSPGCVPPPPRPPRPQHLSRTKSASSLVEVCPCFMLWYSTSKPWFFSPWGGGVGGAVTPDPPPPPDPNVGVQELFQGWLSPGCYLGMRSFPPPPTPAHGETEAWGHCGTPPELC